MSRGRGRGGFGASKTAADLLGVRREDMPTAVREPPPLFPPIDPPLNLEIDQSLVEAKQEFRVMMQNSEYYFREERAFSVQRYTDKYKSRVKNLELGKAVEQVILILFRYFRKLNRELYLKPYSLRLVLCGHPVST